MSIAEKFEVVADEVYKRGKKAQHDEFWDTLQVNDTATDYQYSFGGRCWNDNTFKPKYELKGTRFLRCFAESGIKTIEQTINVEKCTSSTSLQNMFYNADIVTIREIKVSENTAFDSTMFKGCEDLENLNMVGTIGKNGLDLTACTKLSKASLLSVLNACNKEASGVTITLPSKCIDGKTTTKTYIGNDTELNTALYAATANGYTVVYG